MTQQRDEIMRTLFSPEIDVFGLPPMGKDRPDVRLAVDATIIVAVEGEP